MACVYVQKLSCLAWQGFSLQPPWPEFGLSLQVENLHHPLPPPSFTQRVPLCSPAVLQSFPWSISKSLQHPWGRACPVTVHRFWSFFVIMLGKCWGQLGCGFLG